MKNIIKTAAIFAALAIFPAALILYATRIPEFLAETGQESILNQNTTVDTLEICRACRASYEADTEYWRETDSTTYNEIEDK